MPRYPKTLLFMTIMLICTGVAWFVMNQSNEQLRMTHDIIISHHQKSTAAIDSLYTSVSTLLSDSLRVINPRFINEFCNQLSEVTKSVGISGTNERISHLLEAEFSKIQSEYEVLNLWCALLTIVFLIFSFFSIFKANEMANQSEAMLDKMRQIRHDVESKSDLIDDEIKKTNTRIEAITTNISSLEGRIGTLDITISKIENARDSGLKHLEDESKKKCGLLTQQVEGLKNATLETILIEVEKKFLNENNNLLDRLNELESKNQALESRIRNMTEEIEDDESVDNEDKLVDEDEDEKSK